MATPPAASGGPRCDASRRRRRSSAGRGPTPTGSAPRGPPTGRGTRSAACRPARRQTDHHTRVVDEVDDRQVERVGEVDGAGSLSDASIENPAPSKRPSVPSAAHGWPSMRASVPTTARPKRAPISNTLPRHRSSGSRRGCRPVGARRHRAAQADVTAQRSSVDSYDGRERPDVRREVRQEPPDLGQRLVLAVDRVVDGAGAGGDLPPAELLLRQLLAGGVLDERRTGGEAPAPRPSPSPRSATPAPRPPAARRPARARRRRPGPSTGTSRRTPSRRSRTRRTRPSTRST